MITLAVLELLQHQARPAASLFPGSGLDARTRLPLACGKLLQVPAVLRLAHQLTQPA